MRRPAAWAIVLLAAAEAVAQDDDELGQALEKSQSISKYSFSVDLEVEGLPQGVPSLQLTGWYDDDQGLYFSSDYGRFFRKGSKAAVAPLDEPWQRFEDWLKQQHDPGVKNVAKFIRDFKPPHESLRDVEDILDKVEKSGDKDKVGEEECTVFRGPLTDEAAKATFTFKDALRQVEGGKVSATLKLWVDKERHVRKAALRHEASGSVGGMELSVSVEWTVKMDKIDTLEEKPPEDAVKVIKVKK